MKGCVKWSPVYNWKDFRIREYFLKLIIMFNFGGRVALFFKVSIQTGRFSENVCGAGNIMFLVMLLIPNGHTMYDWVLNNTVIHLDPEYHITKELGYRNLENCQYIDTKKTIRKEMK